MTESNTDRLRAEAEGNERPPAPEGAPAIKEFHQLPRAIRAELAEELADLIPQVNAAQKSIDDTRPDDDSAADEATEPDDDSQATALRTVATMYKLLGRIETLLVTVSAADHDVMEAWTATASDQHLLELFVHFAGGFSLGEASSSPN